MTDKLVIIPTYNERENIEKIIRAIFSLASDFDILIVDDDSPDGTSAIVKSLMKIFHGRLYLECRKGKLGLGTAYIHGFKWALQKEKNQGNNRKYDYIFEMDADFSHNPADLIRLYNACLSGADLAIGSRYVKGGKIENWPTGRVLMSYYASVYVRMILWMNIQDTTAGFKCYKRKVLELIELDKIRFVGYAFQIEMKYTVWKHHFKITEVPITFIDRKEGTSKMNKRIFKEAFLGVLQIRWQSFFRKYKKITISFF